MLFHWQLILFIWLLHRRHDLWAGGALGMCVMLKVYPAFLLAFLVFRRRWRALVGCAATMVAIQLLTILLFGMRDNMFFLFELLPHLLREAPLSTTVNLSPGRFMQTLMGVDPAFAKQITRFLSAPLLALSLWIAYRTPSESSRPSELAIELTPFLALMLLTMPNSWVSYQLLLLVPFLSLLATALADTRAARSPWVVAALVSYVFTLFYQPCGVIQEDIPCTETPFFLGLFQ